MLDQQVQSYRITDLVWVFSKFLFAHLSRSPHRFSKVNNNRIIKYIDGLGYVLSLLTISFTNDHENYIYYKREKVSFLDVIANIGAMFSTVQFFFQLFYLFIQIISIIIQ